MASLETVLGELSGNHGISRQASIRDIRAGNGADHSLEFVTQKQLAEAIEQSHRRTQGEVKQRFSQQEQAIGSLREMIANTDSLLERVLIRLEASTDPE